MFSTFQKSFTVKLFQRFSTFPRVPPDTKGHKVVAFNPRAMSPTHELWQWYIFYDRYSLDDCRLMLN